MGIDLPAIGHDRSCGLSMIGHVVKRGFGRPCRYRQYQIFSCKAHILLGQIFIYVGSISTFSDFSA